MDKKTISFAAILILAAALSFYGGSRYTANDLNKNAQTAVDTTGVRYNSTARQRGNGNMSNLVSGKIISQNDQNIVVQLRAGGSQIVFVSPATEISKFVPGTATDLSIDKNVTITGEANPDGSFNAQSIQIRPDMPFRSGPGMQQATSSAN